MKIELSITCSCGQKLLIFLILRNRCSFYRYSVHYLRFTMSSAIIFMHQCRSLIGVRAETKTKHSVNIVYII